MKMKNMKTWLSALLAVMMLLAMTGIAMAVEEVMLFCGETVIIGHCFT